ncbi:histone deacetylase, partial [bacterium]|nr:histone deacetylase [bacterium]
TVNCPLRSGKNDGDFAAVYTHVLKPVIEEYEPGLILVSAGFDAHALDPISGMSVSSRGFAAITGIIQDAALEVGAPVVYTLEGGYNLNALKDSVEHVMGVLKGRPAPAVAPVPFPELENIIRTHSATWQLT